MVHLKSEQPSAPGETFLKSVLSHIHLERSQWSVLEQWGPFQTDLADDWTNLRSVAFRAEGPVFLPMSQFFIEQHPRKSLQ